MADGGGRQKFSEMGAFHQSMTVTGYVLMAFMLYGLFLTVRESSRQEDVGKSVAALMADPAFVARAEAAGYRVEGVRTGGFLEVRRNSIVARCVRANDRGPLPCDPFPRDARYPDADVQVMR